MTQALKHSIELGELCHQVHERDDERVVFEFDGKEYAILSKEEFDYFCAIEDERDNRLCDKTMSDGEEPTHLERLMERYSPIQ